MIFWREAWLRKIGDAAGQGITQFSQNQQLESAGVVDSEGRERLRARLKTLASPKIYFCQSSEILRATDDLSRWERIGKCFNEVRTGNCGWLEMVARITIWVFWKIRRLFLGVYARGNNKRTPVESLKLGAGEWVEVKPVEGIRETLDEIAHNRGLGFTPGMRTACGRRHQVQRRIDRIIVDGTGEMRQLRNTVYLEGSMCGCNQVAFGGCPRGEFSYWREIWLRRAPAPAGAVADQTIRSSHNQSDFSAEVFVPDAPQ
jgi:hypothetical protein